MRKKTPTQDKRTKQINIDEEALVVLELVGADFHDDLPEHVAIDGPDDAVFCGLQMPIQRGAAQSQCGMSITLKGFQVLLANPQNNDK